jgi:hypothetical protein
MIGKPDLINSNNWITKSEMWDKTNLQIFRKTA